MSHLKPQLFVFTDLKLSENKKYTQKTETLIEFNRLASSLIDLLPGITTIL